ncbi:MAG: dihydroneopterin aldolase [Kiritimatiellae bacterium]|nr:dihydroneopterin aldolase [Kiritimatiellia bacterium]
MMVLALDDLAVECIIGERPEERRRRQRLTVNVRLELPETACRTDALADTVDYAALAARISRALREAKCRMLERAARVVMDVCLADGRVRAATVEVSKSGAHPRLRAGRVVLTGKRRS